MKYSDICEAKTKAEMQRRFAMLLKEIAERSGGSTVSHQNTQKSNVGYFAGYYDHATRKKVFKWLGAVHPIFGDVYPSAKQAFEIGKRLGRRMVN